MNEFYFPDVGYRTASFGIEKFLEKINEVDLVSRLDRAIHEVKESGKNCVRKYSGEIAKLCEITKN